jgi:hypothetical protein
MAKFDLKKDIAAAIKKYHKLVLKNESKNVLIEGKIPICKRNREIITEYELRIFYPAHYPFCFPVVFEIGGKIPKEIGRHINEKDGSICFAVRPVEKLKCLNGITSVEFIESIVIPYLAAQILFDNGEKKIIKGGYKHSNDGIKQFYLELFSTENWEEVEKGFQIAMTDKSPKRNAPCYCGSSKKYKKCHQIAIDTLKKLGNEYLKNELELLK